MRALRAAISCTTVRTVRRCRSSVGTGARRRAAAHEVLLLRSMSNSSSLIVGSLLALTTATAAATGPASGPATDAPVLETPVIETPVIGGTAVPPGKWPDAVAVLGASGSCTGTLIAPDVVLTAGHCADANPTTVIANTTDYQAGGGIRAQIKSVTAYPSWETTFDLAVIVLEQPIVGVTPRPLGVACTFQGFAEDTMVHLVGFGLTDTAGAGDNSTLREAQAPVLDADCSGGNGCAAGAAPAGEFVAGGGGTDSCFGDSGGPVYLDTPRGTVVIAAVSRGLDNSATPCGGGGIYVRTDKVVAWIEQTAGKPVVKDSCAGAPPPGGTDEENGAGGEGTGEGTGGEGRDTGVGPSEVTGGCATGRSERGLGGLGVGLAALALVCRRRR